MEYTGVLVPAETCITYSTKNCKGEEKHISLDIS